MSDDNKQTEFGQEKEPLTTDTTQLQTPPTDQAPTDQASAEPTEGETGTGFVGSDGDQSSDYLTKGDSQDFQPDGQGATDTDAGTSDIETGQSTTIDATLDDGADTSQ